MGYISIGGGTGGGLILGPPTNAFTGATLSAAETARDTYATANADWLTEYDNNPTYVITITYGATTLFQARRASAWANVSSVVRGPTGPTGPPGTQVNSDWDATSGVSEILNKPTLAPVSAEQNVQPDWDESNTNSDAFVRNKPNIPNNNDIKDIVGSMVTGNTETGISVTYQTSDRTIDFIVNSEATYNLYVAYSSSSVFTSNDFLDSTRGRTSTTHTITTPGINGNAQYLAFAVPTNRTITEIRSGSGNQINAWTMGGSGINISANSYRYWVSIFPVIGANVSNTTFTIITEVT